MPPPMPTAALLIRRDVPARGRSERGAVAGLEGILFSIMILFGGLVLIVNAWSVIDTHTALDSAAREFIRTYTHGHDGWSAHVDAETAARRVIAARAAAFGQITFEVDDPIGFGPCAPVTVTISTRVPTLRAPFIASFGSMIARSSSTGLVDAHREVLPDPTYDAALTECFDG